MSFPKPLLGLPVLAMVGLATIVARPEPDASVPATLSPWIEGARELAREQAGPAGWFGLRLVAAGCAPDGTGAVMFETTVARVRTYALIGSPSAPGDPGAATTIAGLTEDDFSVDGNTSWLSSPCG